jgi:hypothetical protein
MLLLYLSGVLSRHTESTEIKSWHYRKLSGELHVPDDLIKGKELLEN